MRKILVFMFIHRKERWLWNDEHYRRTAVKKLTSHTIITFHWARVTGDQREKHEKKKLTLILLMWRIWWAPNKASRWQMGFNSVFKGLKHVWWLAWMKGSDIRGQIMQKIMQINDKSKTMKNFQIKKIWCFLLNSEDKNCQRNDKSLYE
jgi:hypothetical protein